MSESRGRNTEETAITDMVSTMETVASIAEGGFRQIQSMARMVELATENPQYYQTPDIVADVMASIREIAMSCNAGIEGECHLKGISLAANSPTHRRLDAQNKKNGYGTAETGSSQDEGVPH